MISQLRVGVLAAALTAAGTGLFLSLPSATTPPHALPLPSAAVAFLLMVSELGRLPIEVRRSAVTLTLTDAALIIALFSMAPGPAVVLRLSVCAPVYLWLNRRSPTRLVFNTALLLFESAMCAALFTRLTHADPLSPQAWLVALLTMQAGGLLASLMVSMAK